LAAIKTFAAPVYSVGFAADARQAYSGAYEPLLRKWDLAGAKLGELPGLKGTSGYVQSMLPAPDGKTLIARGLDGQIIEWDLASGKRLRGWVMHETIGGLALSSDGRHLGVALATGVVYVLRLAPPPGKGGK
jgi:WD40 repeat protein